MKEYKIKGNDLTQAQFECRARKLGLTSEGFWGYWRINHVGKCRHDQLRQIIAAIAKADGQ